MDQTRDISCVMQVNRNCELCRQKVTAITHCINVLYSVDYTGEDNTVRLIGRGNPYILLNVIDSYGEHGKVSNLKIDGEVMNFRGNEYYGQPGFYLPSNSAGYYPPPLPHGYPGNHGYPTTYPPHMSNWMPEPPLLPARPLYSYHYVEPPYPPSGGKCVIM